MHIITTVGTRQCHKSSLKFERNGAGLTIELSGGPVLTIPKNEIDEFVGHVRWLAEAVDDGRAPPAMLEEISHRVEHMPKPLAVARAA